MTIEYNEKGKFFTNVISKEAIPSIIQTLTHRITGKIHVRQGERLKDELDNALPFIAITEAEVLGASGEVMLRSHFLLINREHVVWLIPEDDLQDPENQTGA